jgi:hypothetical protein
MALTPLKALRPVNAQFEGDKGGRVMREGCKSSGASKARGSSDVEKFRTGSAGAGETTKPTGRARVAMTEGEGVVAGLRKLEEETAFGKYAKAAQAGMGRARARPAEEKGGPVGLAGRRGRMGRLAAGPIGPKVKEKFFSK